MAIQIYDPAKANFPDDDIRTVLRKAYHPPLLAKSLLSAGIARSATFDARHCQEALILSMSTLRLTHNLVVLAQNSYRVTAERLYCSDAWVGMMRHSATTYVAEVAEGGGVPSDALVTMGRVIVAQATSVAIDAITHTYLRGDGRRFLRISRNADIVPRLTQIFSSLYAREPLFTNLSDGTYALDRSATSRLMAILPYIFATKTILSKPRYLTDAIITDADVVVA